MSWIVTLTSAMALVICVRELVAIGIETWESRRLKNLDYWLSGRNSRPDVYLNDPAAREYVLTQEQFAGMISAVSRTQNHVHGHTHSYTHSHTHGRDDVDGDEARMFRHFAVMLALGFVAALGTVFGLLTLA